MFKKKIQPPKEGNIKMIINDGGEIIEDERPIEELMRAMHAAQYYDPCRDGCCDCGACDEYAEDPRPIGMKKKGYTDEEINIEPSGPAIFKRSAVLNYEGKEGDKMFNFASIAPNYGGTLTAVYEDYHEELTSPCIVGDEEKAYGFFVPFNASVPAIEFCAGMFGELASNRSMYGEPPRATLPNKNLRKF